MLPTFSRPICPHVLSKDTKPFALPFWNDSTLEWDLYNHVFCCVKLFHSWPFLSWVDCNNNCAPILPAPVTFLIYMRWYAGGYSPNKWFLQTMRQKKWNPETHIHRWSDTTTNPLFILVCILLMLQLNQVNKVNQRQQEPAPKGNHELCYKHFIMLDVTVFGNLLVVTFCFTFCFTFCSTSCFTCWRMRGMPFFSRPRAWLGPCVVVQ